MKAVLHFDASKALKDRLAAAAPDWLRISCVETQDAERLRDELADADALLHVLEPATAALLAMAPRLRLIQKVGVGVNTIDLAEARRRNIRVANMPGTNSQAVSELTLTLMLTVLRKIVSFDAATRAGHGWNLPLEHADDVGELCGRTVGLIGYGQVPRRLVPVLQALGAKVVVHARRRIEDAPAEQVSLENLLARADILSLHIPLTDETRHFVGPAMLAAMRPGAILINTARGALVDERALYSALSSGRLRGAGLDVLETEPAPPGNPLFTLPNIVVTPHIAWLTSETIERSLDVIFDNCSRLRQGLPLRDEIPL